MRSLPHAASVPAETVSMNQVNSKDDIKVVSGYEANQQVVGNDWGHLCTGECSLRAMRAGLGLG